MKKLTGKVRVSLISSTANTAHGGTNNYNSTVRVTNVRYEVRIIAEGKEYKAYSDKFYKKGAIVTIGIISGWNATILKDGALDDDSQEVLQKN